jgi:hypothetical protein
MPGAVSRRVAPFAPLAIALLVQTALLKPGPSVTLAEEHPVDEAVACGDEIPTFEECHGEYPTGCSPAARYDPYLNLLKNQLVPPTKKPIRTLTGDEYGALEERLPPALTKENHGELKDEVAALGEGRVFAVIGFLYDVKKGGKESSNCQLTEADDIDFHLGIGFDPDLAAAAATKKDLTPAERKKLEQEIKVSSHIIEVTPHWRALFKPNWTLAMFAPAVGHQVRVTGQLLLDSEHYSPKDDCAFADAGPKCFRASSWELHPVTRFQVCTTGDSCTATSRGWVDIEKFGAAEAPPPGPAAPTTPG